MNKVVLVGNLTRDPELRTVGSGVSVCTFTVAVQRRFANAQGVREADFINCVAWRQTGEFVAKYFTKGRRIGLVGSIQTRTYDANDGTKRYVTEVVVDEAEFVDSRSSQGGQGGYENQSYGGGYPQREQQAQPSAPSFGGEGFTSADDDELPF